jgi:concentrative nucleoside transporter, CNT family
MFYDLWRAGLGLAGLIGLAFLCSENRRAIDWRLVAGGVGLQVVLVLLFLVVPGADRVFDGWRSFSSGSRTFRPRGRRLSSGCWPTLWRSRPALGKGRGFLFAFQVLPTIVFFSALCSLLYYLGVLQRVVFAFAWVTQRFMRLSGAEALAAAAEIFLGQTESPLMIKPYLPRLTRSELFALMTGGMATIAGGVLVSYIAILGGTDQAARESYAKFLLCASFMAAPASLVVAKILVPQTQPVDQSLVVPREKLGANALDALAAGTADGLKLAANVGAMLIAFIALAAMVNAGLAALHPAASLDSLLGWAFAPLAWLIGVEAGDIREVGRLLGKKVVFNEFVAYLDLGALKQAGALSLQVALPRHLRPVRVRQLRQHRHPARRHRSAGARAAADDGRARVQSGPRWHPGHPDDGDPGRGRVDVRQGVSPPPGAALRPPGPL